MGVVFADSAYWIALWNPRDARHQRAMAVAHAWGASDVVPTQLVLVETLNSMAGKPEHRRTFAAGIVHELEADPSVEIVPQTDAQFRAAAERYAARSDQAWSFTDCASFLVMEERNITEALAYDRDFEQAGFRALLREDRG